MTEQEKREKVIAHLQEARRILGKVDEPTFWLDYVINAVDDALALLKGQEPRVMTLEEMLNLRFQDVVYYEMGLVKVTMPAIILDVIEKMPDGEIGLVQFRMIQEPISNADLAYYNKTWRCWNVRPTEAQMEAIPWE